MIKPLASIGIALIALFAPAALLAQGSADQRFATLVADHWEWYAREVPENSTLRGDNRYNDRLTDQSPAAVQARKSYWIELLSRLRSFDPAQLTLQNRVSLQVLTTLATTRARIDGFFPNAPYGASDVFLATGWSPVTQMYGPQFTLPLLAKSAPFRTVADYEAYLKRLAAVPQLLSQYQFQMRSAVDAGWVPPAVAIDVTKFEAKWKLNQNQTPLRRERVMRTLGTLGGEDAHAIVAAMRGLDRSGEAKE